MKGGVDPDTKDPDLRELASKLSDLSRQIEERATDLRLWIQTALGFSIIACILVMLVVFKVL